jgi:exopolysaccharide biosynthesis polyprenyl glycosylphosphotransferase
MKAYVVLFGKKIVGVLKKENLLNFTIGAIDIVSLLLIFQISFMILNSGNETWFLLNHYYRLLYIYMVPSWILILHICSIAQIPRTSRYSRLFFEYFQFTILNIIILYIYYYFFRLETISHIFIFLFAAIGLVILFSVRIIEYKIFKWYRARGHNYINVILISDSSSKEFIEDLLSRKEWGYRILAIFSDSKVLKSRFGKKVKILPERSAKTIKNLLEIDIVDEVLYFKDEVDQADVKESIRWCEELGVVFRLRSKSTHTLLTNGKFSKIGNVLFLTFVNIPNNSFGLAFKTAMDIYLSFILIIILSPVMLIIAIGIFINSPGPVIFKQARVGLRGRQFYLYKFRTMVVNAEQLKKQLETQNEMDGPVFKIKEDPRVTSIGKILRKTGLDELPQLFNVLKGEMSLIGPRPPLQSETRLYKRWHLRRLSVKPGITCSWQIIPDRNNIKFDNWMKLDLAYIDNWSPRLDFILLIKTIRTVIFGTGR